MCESKYSFCSDFDNDVIDQYDDMLNECYEPVQVGGLTFDPADVIYNCDPIAYRCGLIDYIDSIEEDDE